MNLALTLIREQRPVTPLAAGWLGSCDPAEWLREVAHCRAQGCMVSIFPVAASAADPRAVGILIVPRGNVPNFRPRVLPLTEMFPGVYVPVDANLSVGLLPNEREFFFSYPINFFHPSIGLVGFDPKEELAPRRLLSVCSTGDKRWNLAISMNRFAPEFKDIIIDDPEDTDGMFNEATQDIGDQSGKSPKGGKGALGTAGMLGLGLAGGAFVGLNHVLGMLGNKENSISKKGDGNGSLDSLKKWAEKNWQHLVDSRSREIDRLISLMEKDPDAGLRYALPLAGIEQSRGVAAPSWKLGQRGTRFSHGSGGGPIDGWDLEYEARLRLEKQYREAAQREIALGRFDRAAYIYGNLLGDWNSAARTLADCGRHQDAVSIYLHKLHNRDAAARSLEEAGLLLQAAGIYAECKRFEKAGDLHSKLGNDIKARELWQAEVDAQRDPLEKARILAEKLSDNEAALAILDSTWRSGNQSQQALAKMFAIHREQESLTDALRLLETMFSEPVGSFPLIEKLKLGRKECTQLDVPAFSTAFEDQAYHRIAHALTIGIGDCSGLLKFLPELDDSDLLLDRDAKRYSIRKIPPKIPPSGSLRGTLRPTHVVNLPADMRWDSLATLPESASIAGFGKDMVCVAQVRGSSCNSSALRAPLVPGKGVVKHVAVNSSHGSSRLLYFPELKRLHYQPIDRPNTAADEGIGNLRTILAACPHGNAGDFALLQLTSTLSLSVSIYSESAVHRRTLPIDLAPPEAPDLEWRMAGRGGHLCLSAKGFVAWRSPDGNFATMSLGESPRSLDISPIEAVSEVLISLSSDVLLIEISKSAKNMETVNLFSTSSVSTPPVSCFLPDGSVVIAHAGSGAIYSRGNWLKPCATLFLPEKTGNPIDICSQGAHGFGILTSNGKLLIFEG